MKIFKIFLISAFLIFFISPVRIYAEGELEDEAKIIDEVLDSSSDGVLSENDISVENADNLLRLTPAEIFTWIFDKIKSEIFSPLKLLVTLMSVTVLSSVSSNMYTSGKMNSCRRTGEIVGVLICVSILMTPVSESFTNAAEVLSQGGTFMLAYVPVMSGVIAASGNVTTAGSYNLIVLTVCELSIQISASILMPMLSLCFSVSIVDAINPGISLSGLVSGVKKTVTVILGFIMTIFVGMLSVQSIAGNAADTLSIKTGKYIVSNFVPVVGKAISDAYSTVYGSLGVLKGSVGTVGIVLLLIMVVPPVIKLFLCRAALGIAAVAADIFSCPRLKKLFSDIESVFGIVISIVLVFIIMFIISTVIVMKMGTVV